MTSPDPMAGILPQLTKSLNVQKIAVLRRNGIGDLLTCIPMLRECKRQHPQATLTLIIEKRALECAQAIDSPPWDFLWVMEPGHKYISAWKMVKKLRAQSFDLIVSAKPKPMKLNALVLGFSGASHKRAVCHCPKKWYELAINQPVDLRFIETLDHQALQTLALISPEPKLNALDWPRFKSFSKEISTSSLFKIYLNLSNNREGSRLGLLQMIETLKRLKRPLHLVFAGLKGDLEMVETWQKAFEKENMASWRFEKQVSESFEGTCQRLYESDLIITGDGGLMHMAAACDRPLLALFGQTSLRRWQPLSSRVQLLYHPQRVDVIDPSLIAKAIEVFIQEK